MPIWDREAGDRARRALHQAGGIVSVQQLAVEWGMSRQAVDKRVRSDSFPGVFAVASGMRLYLRCEVETWEQERKA